MNKKDVTEFVIDCLTDAGNTDKQAALQRWLAMSEDNRTLYAELKHLWEAAAAVPPVPFDTAAGWEELAAGIRMTAPGKRIFPWKAIAAAVCLLLAGAGSWWWQSTAPVWKVYVARDIEKDSLLLPDGSLVYLKPNTSLQYKQPFTERTVMMLTGEAYFDVVSDPQRTFTVQAKEATLRVLGTAFNIRMEDQQTEVIVFQGKVSVQQQGAQLVLNSGDGNKGVLDQSAGIITHPQGNYSNQCVWATHDLSFENQEAVVVASTIAAYYGIPEIKIAENLKHKRITLRLHKMPVEQALEILAAVLEE